jgi:hypothetical protein
MSRNFSVRYVFILIGYISCMRFRRFVEYVAWRDWQEGLFYTDGTPAAMNTTSRTSGSTAERRRLVNAVSSP